MTDIDAALAASQPMPETAVTVVGSPNRCTHPRQFRIRYPDWWECSRCGHTWSHAAARKGATSRSYGNRAELEAARRYGGAKVGHHGGPVDIRGTDWQSQMRTKRRKPPAEWVKAFGAMSASTERLPRLLLRFVQPGVAPVDFWVVPGAAWLDWWGKDEAAE